MLCIPFRQLSIRLGSLSWALGRLFFLTAYGSNDNASQERFVLARTYVRRGYAQKYVCGHSRYAAENSFEFGRRVRTPDDLANGRMTNLTDADHVAGKWPLAPQTTFVALINLVKLWR